MQLWIVFSLISMAASVIKVIVMKRGCQNIDSRVVILAGRVVSSLVLLPMLFFVDGGLPTDGFFWLVTLITSIITVFGSIIFTEAVRKGPLALVIPAQAVSPVFAMLVLWLFWHESPTLLAVALILISMGSVAWMLYASHRSGGTSNKQTFYALLSLVAAVIFGISTTLDRVAIERLAQGALAYSACWNGISAVLVFTECVRKQRTGAKLIPGKEAIWPLLLFSISVLVFFYMQQLAVQLSLDIDGAIVNVKSIVTLHLAVVVFVGLIFFKEKIPRQALIAGLIALVSGLALLRVMM